MFIDALIYRLYKLHKILSFREIVILWYFTEKNMLAILDETLIPENCFRYDIDDMRIELDMTTDEIQCSLKLLQFIGFVKLSAGAKPDDTRVTVNWEKVYQYMSGIIVGMIKSQADGNMSNINLNSTIF